jgi:hypothetical protein
LRWRELIELCSILGVALERAMLDPWCSAGAAPEVAELCSVALGALARGGGYAPSEGLGLHV